MSNGIVDGQAAAGNPAHHAPQMHCSRHPLYRGGLQEDWALNRPD